jgi:hypothetical protein
MHLTKYAKSVREGTYRELGHDGLELGRGEDASVAEIF